jgi:hypothetical protein
MSICFRDGVCVHLSTTGRVPSINVQSARWQRVSIERMTFVMKLIERIITYT